MAFTSRTVSGSARSAAAGPSPGRRNAASGYRPRVRRMPVRRVRGWYRCGRWSCARRVPPVATADRPPRGTRGSGRIFVRAGRPAHRHILVLGERRVPWSYSEPALLTPIWNKRPCPARLSTIFGRPFTLQGTSCRQCASEMVVVMSVCFTQDYGEERRATRWR